MRLWVPVDQTKIKGSISAVEGYSPDPKTWRLATRGEKLRWEITRPRYSYVEFVIVWVLVSIGLRILATLTGVRL